MKKILFCIAILLATFGGASAQGLSISDMNAKLPIDPAIKVGKLDNGITYYVRQNHKPENRAELQIVFLAGAVLEEDNQQGLAHFIEHMLFNGTKNFPKDQLVKFLETTGMRFGADVNANTGFDRTYYMLTIPLDKPELLEKGLQVLEDWAHQATFDPQEIEKERGVIMQEWRLYRGASERVQRQHLPNLLYGSQFAKRLPIGDTSIIQTAPRERFTSFYEDWYRPELTAVIAVGDFDPSKIESMIKEHFSNVPVRTNPRQKPNYDVPSHPEPIVSIATDKELPMAELELVFKNPQNAEGTYAAYRRGMVERLFSQMMSLRLMELTRKPKPPYLYAAGGITNSLIGPIGALYISSAPNVADFKGSYETLLTETFRIQQHGFTQSELDRAKTETKRFYEKAFAERDKVESSDYAQEIYRHYYEGEGMPGIAYEMQLVDKFLPEISISEINALAKNLIHKHDMVISVSMPEKQGVNVPTKEDILATYDRISSSKIDSYTDVAADKPLLAKKPAPGKIVERKNIKELGVTEYKLSNGARVVVKPTDFKNDEVLFRAYSFGGSSLVPDSDYYTASLAASIIDDAGVSSFDAITLQKMLTGKALNISPFIGDMTEGMQGQTSPKDMETFMQLMYLYFTEPRLDEEAFNSFIAKQTEVLANSKTSPDKLFSDSLSVILGNHHFRSYPMTEAALKNITLQKAYQIYKQRFADASDFTFFFVGSVKPEQFEPLMEQYIASLPANGSKENFKDVGMKYPTGKIRQEVKAGIEQKSSVRYFISGKFDFTPENRFAVNSLLELFRIRLREVIREDKGGVYGIGAGPRLVKYPDGRYAISIGFGTSPERVDELIKAVDEVIAEMKNTTPSQENLTKVKEILKRDFETAQKENSFWMNQLYTYDYNREDPKQVFEHLKRVEKLKAEDIRKAAQKYLTSDNSVILVLNPVE
ncbi:MAG: M16 family metallopeptidase [Chloroflexota bacterium]